MSVLIFLFFFVVLGFFCCFLAAVTGAVTRVGFPQGCLGGFGEVVVPPCDSYGNCGAAEGRAGLCCKQMCHICLSPGSGVAGKGLGPLCSRTRGVLARMCHAGVFRGGSRQRITRRGERGLPLRLLPPSALPSPGMEPSAHRVRRCPGMDKPLPCRQTWGGPGLPPGSAPQSGSCPAGPAFRLVSWLSAQPDVTSETPQKPPSCLIPHLLYPGFLHSRQLPTPIARFPPSSELLSAWFSHPIASQLPVASPEPPHSRCPPSQRWSLGLPFVRLHLRFAFAV